MSTTGPLTTTMPCACLSSFIYQVSEDLFSTSIAICMNTYTVYNIYLLYIQYKCIHVIVAAYIQYTDVCTFGDTCLEDNLYIRSGPPVYWDHSSLALRTAP